MNHKFLILSITLLLSSVYSQSQSNRVNPLILLTSQNHQPATSIQDIKTIAKNIPNIKALTIQTSNINNLVDELKSLMKMSSIKKQQISSLNIDDLNSMKDKLNINFQLINLQQINQMISTNSNNLLIHLKQVTRQPRKLSQVHQTVHVNADQVEPKSQLFINMSPVTLTGLLVSLFLIIVLLIGVNCLYQIKTNDQFGRTNLWVGKQS